MTGGTLNVLWRNPFEGFDPRSSYSRVLITAAPVLVSGRAETA